MQMAKIKNKYFFIFLVLIFLPTLYSDFRLPPVWQPMNRDSNSKLADKGRVKMEVRLSPKQVIFHGGNGKISPEQVRSRY